MAQFYPGVHEEVQRYFPGFQYWAPEPPAMKSVFCDMSNPKNQVGHQQRAFTTYYAMQFCGPLDLGLDLGSTRGLTPYCVHVDKYATGRANPLYVGLDPVWADVNADMADLSVFPDDCFPLVASNHSLEHVDVDRYLPPEVPRYPYPPPYSGPLDPGAFGEWKTKVWETWRGGPLKEWIASYPKWSDYYDAGIVRVLREQWVRVLRQPRGSENGGLLVLCLPDWYYVNTWVADADHKHAWTADDFKTRVLDKLLDLVEVMEYDTLKNKFSFNVVARRRG